MTQITQKEKRDPRTYAIIGAAIRGSSTVGLRIFGAGVPGSVSVGTGRAKCAVSARGRIAGILQRPETQQTLSG